MLCVGCVLADPPEHGKAEQTPPMLFANQADPSPYEVLNATPGDIIPIKVPLRSEDVGEGLQADLVLNYSIFNPQQPEAPQQTIFIPPDTFENQERAVNMPWDVRIGTDPGCHQLTLAVTHISNALTQRKDDIATVTWWVNISDTDEVNPNLMKDCPTNKGSTN